MAAAAVAPAASSGGPSGAAALPGLSSARGLLSMLDDPEVELQQHALDMLNACVDTFWPEIATNIPKIETLYEDESFPSRELAALVASKVFYHLEELDDALRYALGAGAHFDVNNAENEYVQTILSKCIDEYIRLRLLEYESKDAASSSSAVQPIDPRLTAIVERMFERCFAESLYRHTLGIAIESRRLDLVKRSIVESGDMKGMLAYCFRISQSTATIASRQFRKELLAVLVQLYEGLPNPDYINVCQCLLFLNEPGNVAAILDKLIAQKDDNGEGVLMAYQIAFDLGENQNQPFLLAVSQALPSAGAAATPAAAAGEGAPASISVSSIAAPAAGDDSYNARLTNLRRILSGELPVDLYLHFLYEANHADLNIMRNIKDKLEQRNSITHGAAVICHAIMQAGTTIDTFLRENLDWLSRAQNWAKFTATASIGVIHKGHHKESQKLLQPYLPAAGNVGGSPYQEGGALYALGLIHANHGQNQVQFLTESLRNAGNNEIVQHGACLGLGLSAMASGSLPLFETLKGVVMSESAVAGEAAGLAMGLVLLGSGNGECIQEMLAYAHDTQHEKIIRGLAMGIALICYGQEEEADVVIEQLLGDKDALLRYGGMWSIAMAYACTSNNKALKRLLHVAVSDVDDDVRRGAVIAIGFVLANQPAQVPRVVSLLSESYNPHVRYGACLAVGIACAGGNGPWRADALALLEPLLKDSTDYVRQGAFLGMSMVLLQHNETSEPKLAVFRKAMADALHGKVDTMTKVGVIIAAGIVDAGGRNTTISLMSPAGHKKMAAIVGMAVFTQFWYWYPLVHFISLALSPTAVIGLNRHLQIPEPWSFVSNAQPKLFAYPPPIEAKKAETAKAVKHATLSVTAKAKAKANKKKGGLAGSASAMDLDEVDKKAEAADEKKEGDKEKEQTAEEKKAAEEAAAATAKANAPSEVLSNPARVTAAQFLVLSASPDADARYRPAKEILAGVVMLLDQRPQEPEKIVANKRVAAALPGEAIDEPEPPKPFKYLGD